MKSKIFFIVVLAVLTINLNAQVQKTFSGKFENGLPESGTATYTYYEDPKTLDYVKDGNFKYSYKGSKDLTGLSQTIQGVFKKGKRTGLWNFTVTFVDFQNSNENSYTSGTITLAANYKDGFPEGLWKYKSELKRRKKLYSIRGYSWDVFSKIDLATVTASFKKGVMIDDFEIRNDGLNTLVVGNIDENGFYNKKLKIIENSEEANSIYENGNQISYLKRDLQSGETIEKISTQENYDKIKQYNRLSKAKSDSLKMLDFSVEAIEMLPEQMAIMYDKYFVSPKYIQGDETWIYNSEEGGIEVNIIGGKIYKTKIK